MTLEEGPFKIFLGLWTFTALTENACKVELDLNFEFKSKGLTLAVSSLFSGVANSLVDSLCQRAEQVYGAKNNWKFHHDYRRSRLCIAWQAGFV